MLRSIISIWKYDYLPDGRSGNANGISQGGSDAYNTLADAYIKKLPRLNRTEAYAAMTQQTASHKDAGLCPTGNHSATPSQTAAHARSPEYALNDYALSVVAFGEAPQDVQKYLNRSANWLNVWSHNHTYRSFTDFLAPRLSTGDSNLTDYNPALCGGCSWSDITFEAIPFEYSFTVSHDFPTLIFFMGGPSEFRLRLDYIFVPYTSEQGLAGNGAGINTINNIGNEPDFATPYLYHY